jgi:hypothetical protein
MNGFQSGNGGLRPDPAVYINPHAPKHVRDFFDHFYPDVQRVSAMYFQELIGGFTDGGPPIRGHCR